MHRRRFSSVAAADSMAVSGMNVLGIETSCDETAAAVVRDGCEVLANAVASQVTLHAGYGGVVPELAARALRAIRLVEAALTESGLALADMDAIAVTNAPGLVPALLVGFTPKEPPWPLQRPVVGEPLWRTSTALRPHELLATPRPPCSGAGRSGGTHRPGGGRGRRAGTDWAPPDDAAGEAYDKVAKIPDLATRAGRSSTAWQRPATRRPTFLAA